jgi:hypothetical protein
MEQASVVKLIGITGQAEDDVLFALKEHGGVFEDALDALLICKSGTE